MFHKTEIIGICHVVFLLYDFFVLKSMHYMPILCYYFLLWHLISKRIFIPNVLQRTLINGKFKDSIIYTKLKLCCNFINVFTVKSDQFKASMRSKSFFLFILDYFSVTANVYDFLFI